MISLNSLSLSLSLAALLSLTSCKKSSFFSHEVPDEFSVAQYDPLKKPTSFDHLPTPGFTKKTTSPSGALASGEQALLKALNTDKSNSNIRQDIDQENAQTIRTAKKESLPFWHKPSIKGKTIDPASPSNDQKSNEGKRKHQSF
jgi:hypothetical protein